MGECYVYSINGSGIRIGQSGVNMIHLPDPTRGKLLVLLFVVFMLSLISVVRFYRAQRCFSFLCCMVFSAVTFLHKLYAFHLILVGTLILIENS